MSEQEITLGGVLADLALFSLKRGEFGRAETLIAGLAETRPEDPSVHVLEGLLAFAKQDWKGAEASYRKALGRDADHGLAQAFLAEALIPQKRFREAEGLLAKAVKSEDDAAAKLARNLQDGLAQGVLQQA